MRAFSPLSQTFIYDYVAEMHRQDLDAHVLADRRENEVDRPLENVHLTPVPPRWHPARVALKLGSLLHRNSAHGGDYSHDVRRLGTARALRRLKPDVVHAHFGTEAVQVARVTGELGIPLVVTFYGFDASRLPRDPAWIERYRKLWQQAARVVALSQAMVDELVAIGCPREKCSIVHLAKDLTTYSYSERPPPVRRFLSVGRLVEKKGHLDVVDAMAALGSDSDVELTIIGDGPLRSKIEERVRSHGLQNRVRLLGPLSQSTVMEWMQRADAFVLASRTASDGDQEGTPTVLIEAQAFGLPAVTTWHAGIPEQIPPESLWLLGEEGDVLGIADRMRQLRHATADTIKITTRAGRRKMEEEFDLAVEVGRLRSIYREVANA